MHPVIDKVFRGHFTGQIICRVRAYEVAWPVLCLLAFYPKLNPGRFHSVNESYLIAIFL